MRCALYARYSTDLQNPRSIADQLVECRRHAERQGWVVVADFADAAISGAAMANRPGVQALVAAANARAFDVVLAEDLSRFSRDGGHPWDLYYDLEAVGVQLHTVWRGRVDEMVLGFEGAKNASERKAIGARVRRGQAGLVRDGRQSGPPADGYRIARAYDADGEPIRGLREIDPDRAPLIRRIFAEFVAGSSPHQVAHRLNAEGVPTPSAKGRAWVGSQVADVLKAPIYSGVIVWGAKVSAKDRRTGQRRARPGDPANVVRQPVPELAIVDPDTWAAAQARLAELSRKVTRAGNPAAANAPRRLLTGLVRCGLCGAAMNTLGRDHSYRCWRRTQGGPTACDNARGPPAARLESEVLDTLRADLLHPEVIAEAVREYRDAQAKRGRATTSRRDHAARELAEVRRRAEALLDLPPDLLAGPSVAPKLRDLDARRLALESELARERDKAEVVALHPHAAARYVQLVEDLQARLAAQASSAERDAARAALHALVTAVLIHPEPARGQYRVEIRTAAEGLLPMIAAAAQRKTGT
jgi:site-specific DNA recombinase